MPHFCMLNNHLFMTHISYSYSQRHNCSTWNIGIPWDHVVDCWVDLLKKGVIFAHLPSSILEFALLLIVCRNCMRFELMYLSKMGCC